MTWPREKYGNKDTFDVANLVSPEYEGREGETSLRQQKEEKKTHHLIEMLQTKKLKCLPSQLSLCLLSLFIKVLWQERYFRINSNWYEEHVLIFCIYEI